MQQPDATMQLTLTAPAPVPPREGLPPVSVASLCVSDSGRMCGTLEFAGVALGFQVGEDDDPPLIEDPSSSLGEWCTWLDLSSVLPDGVSSDAQLLYLRDVINVAQQAYDAVVGAAVDGASAFLLAHLNGEAPALTAEVVAAPESLYVHAMCGCGSQIVFTPVGWQHDIAPWFWGDDHAADPGALTEDDQRRMDALLDAHERGQM